ncbi:hypothetical protein BsWGS_12597 [Bradybaena similaris]
MNLKWIPYKTILLEKLKTTGVMLTTSILSVQRSLTTSILIVQRSLITSILSVRRSVQISLIAAYAHCASSGLVRSRSLFSCVTPLKQLYWWEQLFVTALCGACLDLVIYLSHPCVRPVLMGVSYLSQYCVGPVLIWSSICHIRVWGLS